VISIPEDYTGAYVAPGSLLTADNMASHFASKGFRVIGPAFIGYATDIPFIHGDARCLNELDRGLVGSLQSACSGTEWEHGGSDPGSDPFSAVVIDGTLAALAGYEVWAESIAHISVLTHPAFRGRGLGRQVVGHLANRAIDAGLVAQYRTLKTNVTSMKIAATLGFQTYATSVAIRLAERERAHEEFVS
jgi:GNAT superfamily N-acetyltransferase